MLVIRAEQKRELAEVLAGAEQGQLLVAVAEDADGAREDDEEPLRRRPALEDDAPGTPEQVRGVARDLEQLQLAERRERRHGVERRDEAVRRPRGGRRDGVSRDGAGRYQLCSRGPRPAKEAVVRPISQMPVRIAQVSDVHFGGALSLPAETMTEIIERIRRIEPDVVVVAGDLTTTGYEAEYEEAAEWLARMEFPKVVIPGNHDSRNVEYLFFRREFGDPFSKFRLAFDDERAERLAGDGLHRRRARLVRARPRRGPDRLRPLPVDPGAVLAPGRHPDRDRPPPPRPDPGHRRERNIVLDAGDLLLTLVDLDVDLVLSGHKHVPFFWGLNGTLICNSGTAGTRRVRAATPPSWNELRIDASTIKVFTHYVDGRREPSVLFSRRTRALTRESFYVTDAYRTSNQIGRLAGT